MQVSVRPDGYAAARRGDARVNGATYGEWTVATGRSVRVPELRRGCGPRVIPVIQCFLIVVGDRFLHSVRDLR